MELPLVTERLTVRPLRPVADRDAMYAIYSDPAVMRYVLGGPHTSRAKTTSVLRAYDSQQRRTGWSVWGVEENATGELIGDCGLFPYADPVARIEIGYTFARSAWGHGYATEAGAASVRFAFEELRVFELEAVVRPENPASRHVLEKLGFVPCGERQLGGARHEAFRLER